MEKKFSVPANKVFAPTDPKWLEARCLAVGELRASYKTNGLSGGSRLFEGRKALRCLAQQDLAPNPD